MAKNFTILGVMLTLLGLSSFALSGAVSVTALIPAFFGIAIMTTSWLAGRSGQPWRWNIASAALALIGFAGSARGVTQLPQLVDRTN